MDFATRQQKINLPSSFMTLIELEKSKVIKGLTEHLASSRKEYDMLL
jgi:hypothetical protein